jgi:hypothetical protein
MVAAVEPLRPSVGDDVTVTTQCGPVSESVVEGASVMIATGDGVGSSLGPSYAMDQIVSAVDSPSGVGEFRATITLPYWVRETGR